MSNTTITKYVGSNGRVYRTVVREEDGVGATVCKVAGAIAILAFIAAAADNGNR